MIIEYWSDFACPFCYIAVTRMKKALKELEIEDESKIIFKAFRLNPNAKKVPTHTIVESFSRHYYMTMEQAAARVESISAMARADGLVFNYATARNSNTTDALRLAKLAQSKGNDFGNKFIERMYAAYFADNLVLADHDVLRQVSAEMGLDATEVDEVLNSDKYLAEVLSEEREAHALGISAVPFFAINGKYGIPGAIDVRDMKRILMKAFNEEEEESEVSGMVCGPDGCHPAKKN